MPNPKTPTEFRKMIAHHLPPSAIDNTQEWMQSLGKHSYKFIRVWLTPIQRRYVCIDYFSGVTEIKCNFYLGWGETISAKDAADYALALSYAADITRALAEGESK